MSDNTIELDNVCSMPNIRNGSEEVVKKEKFFSPSLDL